MTCPNCQQDEWIPGDLVERSAVRFKPQDAKLLMFTPYPSVTALACRSCGYLYLSVVPATVQDVMKS